MRSTILFCFISYVLGCDNRIPVDTHPTEISTEVSSSEPEGKGSPSSEDNESEELPSDDADDPEPPPQDSGASRIDEDGDGWFVDEDCDDLDDRIHPGAPEFCDGIDTDCDGRIDPPDAVDAEAWFRDADHDGYGTPLDTVLSCTHPGPLWVENDEDCDDMNPRVHPEAEERCDGIDNDCDGVIDPSDSLGAVEWFFDSDGDGYGGPTRLGLACTAIDSGWVQRSDDCNDMSAEIHPDAVEYCDGVDGDCSGEEAVAIATFFPEEGAPIDVTEELNESTLYLSDMGRLKVCEGDWMGRILIDAESTIGTTSAFTIEGIGEVVIDANGSGSVIDVLGDLGSLHIVNVDLTGGEAIRGGAISAESVELELDDVLLTLNMATEVGGAIYVNEGSVVMRSVTLAENVSEGLFFGGGAIYVGVGTVSMEGTTLVSNHAEGMYSSGGAIYVFIGEMTMTASVIEGNTAALSGGGVHVGQGSLNMVRSALADNHAQTGGGAYIGGDVFMSSSVFVNNRSTGAGGGLFLNNSIGWVELDCQSLETGTHGFVRNEAGSTGSAVHVGNSVFSVISSDQCDWGTGATDNRDEDLRLGPYDGEAGAAASFVCEGTDCMGDIGMEVSP